MAEAKQLASLVFVPLPVISHLASAVQMAKLIADRDERLSITILIMNQSMEAKISSYIKNPPHSRVNFVELPQGKAISTDSKKSPVNFVARYVESQKDLVRDAVAEIINSSPSSDHLNFVKRYRESKGIIVNTFLEFESHQIKSLSNDEKIPPIYPGGPILQPGETKMIKKSKTIGKSSSGSTSNRIPLLCFFALVAKAVSMRIK
ncbi:UDP-glycosyltransferase 71E1 [Sesamum angolense]|uniref:UDP-glycosyltransferase 71E1 n=1 Tax=Sesamum angolense TaxID=2727404 RepID=A0AAE1WRH0_9LAMI|nr:UDP-glycosyltransferase 71E1 [Sesamum angolense]